MKTNTQKELAAKIAGVSPKRVVLDQSRMDEISEAITRHDIRSLIDDGAIKIKQAQGVSRTRARKIHNQRVKGRRKGHGRREGKANARLSDKKKWMQKIRLQRTFLKSLRDNDKITQEVYKDLYKKSKGGFFRSKRHIQLYISEHNLLK